MGQTRWGWACALCAAAMAVTATRLAAAETEKHETARERIEKALDQKLKAPIDAPGIPLNQITDVIASDYNITIVFDVAALDAIGSTPETEISISLRDISLRSALELMLWQHELTFIIDNEVLAITTRDEAESRLEIHVYPIADLQAAGPIGAVASGKQGEPATLGSIVANLVESDSWAVNGTGEGELQEWPGMLIVGNTARVHQGVERLLADMRKVIAKNDAGEQAKSASADPIDPAAHIAEAGEGMPGDFYADPAHSYGGYSEPRPYGGYGGPSSHGAYAPLKREERPTPAKGGGGGF